MAPLPIDAIRPGSAPPSDQRILDFLRKNKKTAYTIPEIAKAVDYSVATVNLAIKRLLGRQDIERARHGRSFYYFAGKGARR